MPNPDLSVYPTQVPRLVARDGVRIREDVLFTDPKGEESERARKRAEGTLVKLKEILPKILEPDETVLYIIKKCQAPMGALEQFMLGWWAFLIGATTLVFTNARLLHFGVDSKGNWNRTLRSVRWGDLSGAKTKGLLNKVLILKYANGEEDKYWRLQGRDSKKAKSILAAIMPATRGEASVTQGMVSLCPDCRTALTPRVYRCQQCGLTFKDEKTLLKRTLLIPGGGYFYVKIWALGLLGFFFDGLLTLGAIYSLLLALGIVAAEADSSGRPAERGDLWFTAGFLLLLVAFQKLLEYQHSRHVIRSYLPRENKA